MQQYRIYKTAFTSADGTFTPSHIGIPASIDMTLHISFDYAQQLHYPCNPLQLLVHIIGVCAEGIPMQINYEAVDTGKGSNSVVSYLHHFLSVYSMGATDLTLHADNCSGQNKNNMIQVC